LSPFVLKIRTKITHNWSFSQPWDKTRHTKGEPFDGRKEKEKARGKEKEGSCSEKGEGFFRMTYKLSPRIFCLRPPYESCLADTLMGLS